MSFRERLIRFVPPFWLGALIVIASLAPTLFASLDRSVAGSIAGTWFAREAAMSLLASAVMLLLIRQRGAPKVPFEVGLVLLIVATVVIGYYVVTPWFQSARARQPTPLMLSAGQWHGVSMAFYSLRIVLVAWLSWRVLARGADATLRRNSA